MAASARTKKAPPKAQNRSTGRQMTMQEPGERGIWREVTGIACIGVGLVFLYFILSNPADGAGLALVRVLRGIAGSMRILIPVVFCWIGILFIFSGREKSLKPGRIALISLIPLIVFTGVHVFSFDSVCETMRIYTYSNFLTQSYAYTGGGAGVLGALLTWPLYYTMGLGKIGSTLVLSVLLLSDLVLLRTISLRSIGTKVREGYGEYRERSAQRANEREERRVQQQRTRVVPMQRADAFDDFDEAPPVRRGRKPTTIVSDPEGAREMVIERITSDALLPGEPNVQLPPDDDELESDVPLFLTKSQRARKKKGAQPEPIAIKEPEPIRRVEMPVNDEPFDLDTPVDQTEDDYYASYAAENEIYDDSDAPPFDLEDAPPFDLEEEADPVIVPDPPKKATPKREPAPVIPIKKESAPSESILEEEPYNYPPIDLLEMSRPSKARNQEQTDREKADKLVDTLASFGITATLIGIAHGPTVTRFELSPAAGIKVSRITSLADDIALNLAAISVRIEAPIPGKAAVGVEVPNDSVEMVPLRDVLESNEARKHPSRLMAALGRDNAGRNIVADLAKMPHVLIAGATGAGKSVCINCIICSILYRATPDEVKLIMIDPKVVELSAYNGIPHLLVPVVTDPKKAASALDWAVNEMGVRYKKFAELGVRDMKGYNLHRPEDEPAMPQIVIIIDELADLMMVTPGEVEDSICRLAQLARAAGIHLVIATQRPSVNVITGVIKANIPSRIAFTVASQVDSRTILDVGGAEKLLGRGDMLFAPSGTNKPVRVQGAWISDDEVHDVVEYIKVRHDAEYDEDIIEHMNSAEMSDQEKEDAQEEYDELLPQAVETVIEAGQASISMLQRKLRVGYARAGRLIDEMAVRGIVSQAEGAKPRNVLISREQYRMMFED